MKRIASFFLFFLIFNNVFAARTLSDSAKISVLVNSPGSEVYSLFGHACIRVADKSELEPIDLLFNYGIFNFNTPNFLYRFIKGETDYMLGVTHFNDYIVELSLSGQQLEELELDLNPIEKQKIWDSLIYNARPENRIYRYNFIYDNCATRIRDMIENCIDGKVEYQYGSGGRSFRSLINQYAPADTWAGFGMDLLIGASSDIPQKEKYYDFLPDFLMHDLQMASIIRNDSVSELVKSKQILLSADEELLEEGEGLSFPGPVMFFWGLIGIVFVLSLIEMMLNYHWRVIDIILFFLSGCTGVVIAFLTFASLHPIVSPNYLLLCYNPMQFLLLPLIMVRKLNKYENKFHSISLFLILFIIFAWTFIPQERNYTFLPVYCLMIRSFFYVIRAYLKSC